MSINITSHERIGAKVSVLSLFLIMCMFGWRLEVLASGTLEYAINWVDIVRGGDNPGFNISIKYSDANLVRVIVIYDAGKETEIHYVTTMSSGSLRRDFAYPHFWGEEDVVTLSLIIDDQLYIDNLELDEFSMQGTVVQPISSVDTSEILSGVEPLLNSNNNPITSVESPIPSVESPIVSDNLPSTSDKETVSGTVHLDKSADASFSALLVVVSIIGSVVFILLFIKKIVRKDSG